MADKTMKNLELTKPQIYTDSEWNFKWDQDLQPIRNTPCTNLSTDTEIQVNHQLAIQHKDELVADVTKLVAEFAPDAMIDTSQLIKSVESIRRKVSTDENVGGDPRGVSDYLRIRVTVRADDPAKAIKQIEDLREQLTYDTRVSSYKDQFRVPCPEGGHRKFVASRIYGEGETSIKAEIQICHEAMEIGAHNDAAKALRDCERSLAPFVKTMRATGLSAHWANTCRDLYEFVQAQRRAINNENAAGSHLNILLNEDIKNRYAFNSNAKKISIPNHLAAGFNKVLFQPLSEAASKLPPDSQIKTDIANMINAIGNTSSTKPNNLH